MTYCSVGGGLPKARGLVTTITVFILKQHRLPREVVVERILAVVVVHW
jgi:hypothetical protein